jgi:hypothetical protein
MGRHGGPDNGWCELRTGVRKAIELDPNYLPVYGMCLSRAYLFTRQPEAPVPHLQDAAGRGPDYWPAHLFPGSAYGHIGRPEEVGAALAAARRRTRLASLRDADPADDFKAGPERDYFLEGLALASRVWHSPACRGTDADSSGHETRPGHHVDTAPPWARPRSRTHPWMPRHPSGIMRRAISFPA